MTSSLPDSPWSPAALARLRGVLCDIDGTITTDGRLSAAAYDTLGRLDVAGLLVGPVTGRPAGWCDLIARFWPVAAVVGENGAFYYRYDHAARRMTRRYARGDEQRARDRERLRAIAAEVLRQVPGSALAVDQGFREADIAIDYCEDVAPLPDSAVQRIVDVLRGHGLTVKVSSIHVNAWFGAYDKLGMTQRLLAEEFGIAPAAQPESFAFAGDSPNDEPMFEYFAASAGVANIARFIDGLRFRPAHVTRQAEGAGFVELAELILQQRKTV